MENGFGGSPYHRGDWYHRSAGSELEPQGLPVARIHPCFPRIILHAGERHHEEVVNCFLIERGAE